MLEKDVLAALLENYRQNYYCSFAFKAMIKHSSGPIWQEILLKTPDSLYMCERMLV